MIKLLVTGSRNFPDEDMVAEALMRYTRPFDVIIHGDCPTGADYYARRFCQHKVGSSRYHIAIPAKWGLLERYAAGPQRNSVLVSLQPDLVLAFFAHNEKNAGTTDCVRKAKAKSISVLEFWA